jgi:hypothetical protein
MKKFEITKINQCVKSAAMEIVIKNTDALKIIQEYYEFVNTILEYEVFKRYVMDKVNNFYGDTI